MLRNGFIGLILFLLAITTTKEDCFTLSFFKLPQLHEASFVYNMK
jgi:hypothetical protein